MAENSGFFRSVNGDRKYSVSFLAKWAGCFVSNGVYNGELAVTAGENMQVVVPAGRAWLGPNGERYKYENDSDKALPIANADGVLARKDTVVLRWDVNERSITAQVLSGEFSSNPVAPAISRTAEQYDLKLAEIHIAPGATAITQAVITDTRLDSAVCGIVTSIVTQVDTSTFYNQIQSDLAQFKAKNQAEFTTWFQSIRDVLDESAAGNLLNMIQTHEVDTSNPHRVTTQQLALTSPSSLTLYVSPTGSDNNNGSTADTPLQTIQKALSFASPWTKVNIRVADGTYDLGEGLDADKLYNIKEVSGVEIIGTSGNTNSCILNNVAFTFRTFVRSVIQNITLNMKSGLAAGSSIVFVTGGMYFYNCVFNGNLDEISNVTRGCTTANGNSYMVNCVFNNLHFPLCASQGATITSQDSSGIRNYRGLVADGGIIISTGSKPISTTGDYIAHNGQIFDEVTTTAVNKMTFLRNHRHYNQVCISDNGNDISGDGSAANPFATINRALETAKEPDVAILINSGNLTISAPVYISNRNVEIVSASSIGSKQIYLNAPIICVNSALTFAGVTIIVDTNGLICPSGRFDLCLGNYYACVIQAGSGVTIPKDLIYFKNTDFDYRSGAPDNTNFGVMCLNITVHNLTLKSGVNLIRAANIGSTGYGGANIFYRLGCNVVIESGAYLYQYANNKSQLGSSPTYVLY